MKNINSSHATMLPITAFFDKKAGVVLAKVANRVADLTFFEQVLARIKAGEDMTEQLAAFKRVNKTEAVKSLQALIKRCKDDLKNGYWEITSRKITTKVKAEFLVGELVPRYTVDYQIAIKSGVVSVRVETAGITAEIHSISKKCKGIDQEQAFDEVMQELVLSGLR